MKKSRFLLFLFCSLLTLTEAQSQNQLLRELAKEDQDSRRGKEIARTDDDRVRIVLSLIGQGELKTPEDKFNAALILDHTPLLSAKRSSSARVRIITSSLITYFRVPSTAARYLIAASIDRYLSMTEGYQKYGTNRIINQETGKEELVPIDRKTPDSERIKYGVLPLAELLKRYPEQPQKKPRE